MKWQNILSVESVVSTKLDVAVNANTVRINNVECFRTCRRWSN